MLPLQIGPASLPRPHSCGWRPQLRALRIISARSQTKAHKCFVICCRPSVASSAASLRLVSVCVGVPSLGPMTQRCVRLPPIHPVATSDQIRQRPCSGRTKSATSPGSVSGPWRDLPVELGDRAPATDTGPSLGLVRVSECFGASPQPDRAPTASSCVGGRQIGSVLSPPCRRLRPAP